MTTRALRDYDIPARDRVGNFHGNQLIYVHWEEHLSFCAALCFPLPPQLPLSALITEILPAHYGMHPDWPSIDWANVRWQLDGRALSPDSTRSLADNGFRHKSLLRFWTPGLNGYRNSYS